VKLLYCLDCQDVVRLFSEERACKCGKVRGRYLTNTKAEHTGGVKLAFNNLELVEALRDSRHTDHRCHFQAFVCPIDTLNFTRVGEPSRLEADVDRSGAGS
jgi:hypothetical protein